MQKTCPFTKTLCKGSRCAIYMNQKEKCAFLQLAEDLLRIRVQSNKPE
jgi:hypothetical protein